MWSSRSQPPQQARGARATPARAPGIASRTRCRGPAGPEGWPKTEPTVVRRRRKVVAPRPLRPDDSQRLQYRNARGGESGRRVWACVRAMSASGPKPSWAAVGAAAARRRLSRQSESIYTVRIDTLRRGLHRRPLRKSDRRRPVLRRGTTGIARAGAPGHAQSDGASSAAAHAAESARRRVRPVSPRRRRRSQPPSWR